MKRHFYISNDLDDLDKIEDELEHRGVHKPQIHVFSKDETGVETHDHLHNIESVFKNDVVHSTIAGAWTGIGISALVMIVVSYTNWPASYSWVPFIFLAIVLLGFCTWVGGLIGIQKPHHDFRRFERQLREGKHVFIVDVDPEQEDILGGVEEKHPGLQLAGTGKAPPRWFVMGQHNVQRFTSETFP